MDIWTREEELIRRNAAIDSRDQGNHGTPLRKSRSISKIPIRGDLSPEKRTQFLLKNDVGLRRSTESRNKETEGEEEEKRRRNRVGAYKDPFYGKETRKKKATDEDLLASLRQENEVLKKEKCVLQRQVDRNIEAESKRKTEVSDLKLRLGESQRLYSNATREIEEKERQNKKHESTIKTLQLRLERQDESLDKSRNEVGELKALNKSTKETFKVEKEEGLAKLKACERDLERMASAYSKQQELVEVLKKQKLHLEAAQVLQFSEEEFLQSLNWKVATSAQAPLPEMTAS
ncbi:uncharacterized protein [Lepeophtheirus salmonis]|uniref:Testisexpressed sequence 9 proteinlike [Hydra vulgaris] n=1 Tax=Lepeophtheirus salmonis TaxID=72036 RepID=A0A0K2TDM2_LEPSM|nr:testis-expressed protein 9-like [Lepeophtheirus salmonis]